MNLIIKTTSTRNCWIDFTKKNMSKSFQFSTDALTNDDVVGDDIESEYDINPSLLNAKYSGFKKQYEEEEEEEEESDNDYDDSTIDDVKEAMYTGDINAIDEEDDDVNYYLKSTLRIIYKVKQNWIKILLYFLLFITNLGIISYFNSNNGGSGVGDHSDIINIRNFGDLTKNIQHLQYQINEINQKQKTKLHEFKNYLDLKLDEFNLNFKKIDKDIEDLKRENSKILDRVNKINIGDIEISNDKLPILLDEHNNIKVIPEFSNFLQKKIQDIIDGEINGSKFKLNYKSFIENHVEDIINSKVGFMNKDEILSLITLQFQENKKKLINEIKTLTRVNNIPQKLVETVKVKKPNGKINYGQAISGARIINYLTSKTFKPRFKKGLWDILGFNGNHDDSNEVEVYENTSPFIVLTSDEGYWRSSQIENTQISIKFLEPIYMNELQYYHGDVLNGGIITSCPKHLSLYVQIEGGEAMSDEEIQGHFKISEMVYDVNKSEQEEQGFEIPEEVQRKLVKSVIIVAKDNYGNEFYTSFHKFKVYGMTKFDLYSVKKILNNDEIDDAIKRQYQANGVKSFGDDRVVYS